MLNAILKRYMAGPNALSMRPLLMEKLPWTELSLSNLLPLSLPEQVELLISRNLLSSMSLILSHTWHI